MGDGGGGEQKRENGENECGEATVWGLPPSLHSCLTERLERRETGKE
jgi:hypothetical protein